MVHLKSVFATFSQIRLVYSLFNGEQSGASNRCLLTSDNESSFAVSDAMSSQEIVEMSVTSLSMPAIMEHSSFSGSLASSGDPDGFLDIASAAQVITCLTNTV